jgi:hypothetical protein
VLRENELGTWRLCGLLNERVTWTVGIIERLVGRFITVSMSSVSTVVTDD